MKNPFEKPVQENTRLKIMLFGQTGVGKTVLSLSFANVCLIDTEKGSNLYSEQFNFERLNARTFDEIEQALLYLKIEKHKYATLVIDPITLVYDDLIEVYRQKRVAKDPSNPDADLVFKDWGDIKGKWKKLMRLMLSLDMNIVVVCREKQKIDAAGTHLGIIHDGEKNMEYEFDIILNMFAGKNKFMAKVKKDRTNKLPKIPFEISYKIFKNLYGDILTAEAKPVKMSVAEQHEKIQELRITLRITVEKFVRGLDKYDVKTLEELSFEQAKKIINNLEKQAKPVDEELEKAKNSIK